MGQLKDDFTEQVKNCIADINRPEELEALCRFWMHMTPPHLSFCYWSQWNNAQRTLLRLFCDQMAQLGTHEANEALSRLRREFAE